MKKLSFLWVCLLGITRMAWAFENTANNGMIVRISEIEVYPEYLEEYLSFAKDVAAISVEQEDGVISIYPMMEIRDNHQIRILEIYKDDAAYKKHIASKHFQKYKQATLHMVKSLDLVDMYQLEPDNFTKIFKKTQEITSMSDIKIKLSFNNQETIIKMTDNSATKQFLSMLPAEFTFSDFAGEEKITNFPKPIDLSEAPRGMIASKGKLFIYAPWGNFGIFYKNHGTTLDNSLIELGEVESGLEYLKEQHNDFKAKIEILN